MSELKAILNIPETCNKYIFSERKEDGNNRCKLDTENDRNAPILWRAEWCPLLKKQSKIVQKVVRTYPNNYDLPNELLYDFLSDGWKVVMCNPISLKDNQTGLEYIIEKEESGQSQ